MDDVVSASASLQEELENIHTLSEQYEAIAQTAQTQGEMNMSSGWFLKIWDTELNNLWSRFSDSADAQTKEKVLAEQRSWNSMKEEVAQHLKCRSGRRSTECLWIIRGPAVYTACYVPSRA